MEFKIYSQIDEKYIQMFAVDSAVKIEQELLTGHDKKNTG